MRHPLAAAAAPLDSLPMPMRTMNGLATVIPVIVTLPILLFLVHFLAVGYSEGEPPQKSSSTPSPPLTSQQPQSSTSSSPSKSKLKPKASSTPTMVAPKTSTRAGRKGKQQPRNSAPLSSPALSTPPKRPSLSATVIDPQQQVEVEDESKMRQNLDAILVLDVEATCSQGVGFDFPNEIIEFPVVLLRWADKDSEGRASKLVKVAEFRSYVRPTWRETLTPFCTALTGISQDEVSQAPTWPEMLVSFNQFLSEHGLLNPQSKTKFVFASDGPFDVRDFVVKQCYISKTPVPDYFQKDILDVRKAVTSFLAIRDQNHKMQSTASIPSRSHPVKRQSLNLHAQLQALKLGPFEGRQHCGIDDARNIARLLIELARQPMRVEANTFIHPNRRWWWMTKSGEVDFPEEYCKPYSSSEYGCFGVGSPSSSSGMLSGMSSPTNVGSPTASTFGGSTCGGSSRRTSISGRSVVLSAPPSPTMSMASRNSLDMMLCEAEGLAPSHS